MATVIWKGDAASVAQETTCTIGGTIDVDQIFTITIGSKSLSITAGSTAAADVVSAIAAAWENVSLNYPEFSGIALTDHLDGSFTLTGAPGVPFSITLATTEGDGSPADLETFTQATGVEATGPAFWSNPRNWSTGAVPVTGDQVVVQNSAASILYGLNQSSVTLASLSIDQSFSGTIGLPRTHSAGYVEYRDQYLRVGATAVTIGGGAGGGSGRIKLDTGSVQTTLDILDSGNPAESGVKAILWKGTHASNAVTISKGSLGVATFASETATIATLKVGYRTNVSGDCDVRLGAGCSTTAIVKTGGSLETNSSFSTLVHDAGEMILAAGTPGTLTIHGGAVRYRSAGNYTQATIEGGGELDFRQDLRPRTGTSTTLRAGAVLRDPAQTVTFTNPIALACELADVVLDLGHTFNLQRS